MGDQTPTFPPDSPCAPTGFAGQAGSAVSFPSNVPALSIRQPWAWAIVTVGKDIENRCWYTKFRGRVLIHAAKGCRRDEYIDARDFILDAVAPEYRGVGITLPGWKNLQRGGIIGEAEIVSVNGASYSAT